MESLRVDLHRLAAFANDGGRAGTTASELLIGLTAAALRETATDLELLQSVPVRDDAAFGDRPKPTSVTQLDAWLYSASRRVAYAVHAPDWAGAGTGSGGWQALLQQHLHGDFHSGHGWTPVNAVAMPVRRPFDEPGLRIRPLLSLWAPVSQHGTDWFSETMTASVHDGRPHVVAVQVFSAAAYLRRLLADGQHWFELSDLDRRPALVSPARW
jgi:hypothetical protein